MNSHLNQEAMPTIHRHFDLFIDDDQVAMTKIERTLGFRISLDETFDIDSDAGEPVSEDDHVLFDFEGKLSKVVVKLD